MLGWTRHPQHDLQKRGFGWPVALVLGIVSAGGILASLALWVEAGVVDAAIAFAATTGVLYGSVWILTRRAQPTRDRGMQSLKGCASDNAKRCAAPRS